MDLNGQILENNETTEQIWLDFNPSYKINEHFYFYGDVAARTIFPNEWYRFIIGPSVKFKNEEPLFKKLDYEDELHAGIRFLFTSNKHTDNRLEIRLFQGYKIKWLKSTHFELKNYLRIEERFENDTKDWDNNFDVRLRIATIFTYKFNRDLNKTNKRSYMYANIELFGNLNGVKQFNDVIRATAGYGHPINDKWRGEINLSYFYTRGTIEESFNTNDMVLRLRAFYKIL